jgi:hypothetical protein
VESALEDDFSVRFGRTARTLEYEDLRGKLVFTFDVDPNDGKSIVLEHYPASMPLGPEYGVAFDRTKKFLKAHGYDVREY